MGKLFIIELAVVLSSLAATVRSLVIDFKETKVIKRKRILDEWDTIQKENKQLIKEWGDYEVD